MVFKFLKKKDYWTEVGGVEGFTAAIKQLGSDYHGLDDKSNGYSKSDSIWGRLTDLTQISKKDTFDTRKWLYTTRHDNRRKIRTTFLATQIDDLPGNSVRKPSDDATDITYGHTVVSNAALSIVPSNEPKVMRSKDVLTPRNVQYFTITYEQWRAFYDHKTYDVYNGWGNQLAPHLVTLNSNLFSARGHCKNSECPVRIEIDVEHEVKNKGSPCMFKVVVIGDKKHDPKKETTGRPLTGAAREAMAKEVNQHGPLAIYERNLRYANADLLKEGNFSEVPSIDVLKRTKQ
ncbi:unnamed protein product [Didymodactylos carnosus]|uniref:Uncharacterized protein n=1 Tax=Didymodactylos carnosus TaxID=1234261 RepID=A0A815ZXM5_9BILA|nr:unnamed protein product [Didymodactylos carnosus]CAF4459027.1 unnamed protein product [Didymodactylos carnosus]